LRKGEERKDEVTSGCYAVGKGRSSLAENRRKILSRRKRRHANSIKERERGEDSTPFPNSPIWLKKGRSLLILLRKKKASFQLTRGAIRLGGRKKEILASSI